MYPLIVIIILMLIFPGIAPLHIRVYGPFVVFLGVFALLPISALLFPPFIGFLVAMFCTVIVGLADAVSQASLFGWAGVLPSEYVQALNLGTGVSGLADAVLRIISKVSFSNDASGMRQSVALFFSISAAITLMCIASFWFVSKHPFTLWYMQRTVDAARARLSSTKQVQQQQPTEGAMRGLFIYFLTLFQKRQFCRTVQCLLLESHTSPF